MKKIILLSLIGISLWGCYTQIGIVEEEYSNYTLNREYSNYSDGYDYTRLHYYRYIYRNHAFFPRYSLFFRYYTPDLIFGWVEGWYYDPYWFSYYCWDYYDWWYFCGYYPAWYYYSWWYRPPMIIVINNYSIYSGAGKTIVYRTRNFGMTRGRLSSGNEEASEATSLRNVLSPSRNLPVVRGSGDDVRNPATNNNERLKKIQGTKIERNDGERRREIGSSRVNPSPRVIPKTNDEDRESSIKENPFSRRSQPRRNSNNLDQIHRNGTIRGNSTEMEIISRNGSGISTNNSSGYNNNQGQERKRELGNKR